MARRTLRLQQQQQLVCMASKLEDVPLFADTSSVGSKPSAAASSSSGQKAGPAKLEDIPLNSEVSRYLERLQLNQFKRIQQRVSHTAESTSSNMQIAASEEAS